MPMRDILESLRATALAADQITDAAIAQNQTQANSFWAIREGLVEGHAITGSPMRRDVSVTLGTMLAQDFPAWMAQIYGHAGDGNLHFNAIPPKTSTPHIAASAPASKPRFSGSWPDWGDPSAPNPASAAAHAIGWPQPAIRWNRT